MAAGELVAVSGWEASDLLWAVAGFGHIERGEVLVDGRSIVDRQTALAAGLVIVPDGGGLASLLTAYENVLLPILDGASFGSDPVTAARQALRAVGLDESADHLVEELSGGQQQRVEVARALACEPNVLLADQVTTDLDPANRVRVLGLLRRLAQAGAAVLLATDDPVVIEACDRAWQP